MVPTKCDDCKVEEAMFCIRSKDRKSSRVICISCYNKLSKKEKKRVNPCLF